MNSNKSSGGGFIIVVAACCVLVLIPLLVTDNWNTENIGDDVVGLHDVCVNGRQNYLQQVNRVMLIQDSGSMSANCNMVSYRNTWVDTPTIVTRFDSDGGYDTIDECTTDQCIAIGAAWLLAKESTTGRRNACKSLCDCTADCAGYNLRIMSTISEVCEVFVMVDNEQGGIHGTSWCADFNSFLELDLTTSCSNVEGSTVKYCVSIGPLKNEK